MATQEDFDRIKKQIKTDKNMKKWYEKLVITGDVLLREDTVSYTIPDNKRLLPISRIVLNRTITLSLLYKLTGETKYFERAWKELDIVSDVNKFPDWNHSHFLDTAEMTTAVSIGFDWLYDSLSYSQKEQLINSIINNSLLPAKSIYRGENSQFWTDSNNNWNAVCNSGVAIGALAIGDESTRISKLSGLILEYALKNVKNSIKEYAPDGGTKEGPNYWNYSTLYLVYLFSALDTSLGTDFNLSQFKGLSETGYYPIYMTGSNGIFNIGDGSESTDIIHSPQMFWLANRYDKPEFAYYALNSTSPMNLIWYKPSSKITIFKQDELALDKYFLNGDISMRSSWSKDNSIYLGVHGGKNNVSHGDLDIGTFVIDAMGERWINELGSDNYNLPGYFEIKEKRWEYYRKRTEGQNTILINPSSEPGQNINGTSKVQLISDYYESLAILDMTNAYDQEYTELVKRTVGLVHNKKNIIVKDLIRLKKNSDIYWFAHTKANIKLSKDRKKAVLSILDKRLILEIKSPSEGQFSIGDAEPLTTSPNPSSQNKNEDYKKLVIHIKNIKQTEITVLFQPEIKK